MYISFYIKQWPMRYEQVEQDSCADPGFYVRRRGGGKVEARRPENSLDNVFLVINLFQLILQFTEWNPMVLLQRGGGGPTSSRGWGCPKKPI